MKNILVSTLGGTWLLGAELVTLAAYPNIEVLKNNNTFQQFHKVHLNNKEKIDELWFICTHGSQTNTAIDSLKKWIAHYNRDILPKIKFLSLDKLEDLTTPEETKQMADFIYRVVLKAHEEKRGGKLFLSLAGGRKTMSSDMQRAAEIFGCNALIHLADNNFRLKDPKEFIEIIPQKRANDVFVIEVLNNKSSHFITQIEPIIKSSDFSVNFNRENLLKRDLYDLVEQRLNESESLLYNAYRIRTGDANQSIFHGLQQLPPAKLQQLSEEVPDKTWLKALPKADLHFHFGGTLNTPELIETALANQKEISDYLDSNSEFKSWYHSIKEAIKKRDDNFLIPYIRNKNKLRTDTFPIDVVKPPYVVAAFISTFEGDEKYLDQLIFGEFIDTDKYWNIGITSYEQLGDLQGSALLQSKASIEKSCDLLLEYCKKENLKYLEVRCSPCNYTRGGLSAMEVVRIMYNKLSDNAICDIRVILIGSRHSDMAVFNCHVELAKEMLKDRRLRNFIVGFDVAGDESKAKPATLRAPLRDLMLKSMHITIHAGENQPVSNIWEAVYELNADRVGHGLTLVDNKDLMYRFRDRNIFVELCPSSNYQISDYGPGSKDYPLRELFENGVKITLNTDNTGISRTSITNEYFLMTKEEQLTKMEVLQLIRNSFQGAFLTKDEKKQLLLQVEEELYDLILKENTDK